MGKNIDFRVNGGQPMVITIEKDGKTYELRVGVVVLSIEDKGEEIQGGLPSFGIRANLAIDTQEKTE